MGLADCSSQTGPEHWLFSNLTELSVLAPHFLPVGWGVVTYSCSAEESMCLGFAHNLFHPQLRRFVCDRAIYISQLSYSVGSVRQMAEESNPANRFDGFQITCEQYHVGGPSGKKEKYESIVFIQYLSELLNIIETLDQKSSTVLFSPEPTLVENGVDSTDDLGELSDIDNFHTFQKMFSHKVSSKGRTIQLSSKMDNVGKASSESTVVQTFNALGKKTNDISETSQLTPVGSEGCSDTITISDADGNVLAQIQDPSLSLEMAEPDGGKNKTTGNVQTLDHSLGVESQTNSSEDNEKKNMTENLVRPNEGGDVMRETSSSNDNIHSTLEKQRSKKRKRKNVHKSKITKDSSAKDNTSGSDPTVCPEFDFDPISSSWNCDVCHSSFAESDELLAHLNTHAELKRFRCELCGIRFTKRHNQRYHVKTVHEGRRNFKCHVCFKTFTKGHDLKRHSMTHETIRDVLVCKYCKKVYYTQQNLDLHVAGHEGDDKGFRWCLICGLKFSYHQHKYHMKKHKGPADCFDCGRTFSNVDILRQHLKMDHVNAVTKCSSCADIFRNKTEWKAHFKATHECDHAAIYQCQVCLRTYPSAHQLKMHSVIHVEGKRTPRPRKNPAVRKSTANASPLDAPTVSATSFHLPFSTSVEMEGSNGSQLAAIEVDGQTVLLARVDGRDDGSAVDTIVEGDLNDVLIIPSATQTACVENQSMLPSQTIWVDGVSSESFAFMTTH